MTDVAQAQDQIGARGPRYAVSGQYRAGEHWVRYAYTAEQAEKIREETQGGRYPVKVHPPAGSVDLVALGRDLARARRAAEEATAVLRAAVKRAAEEGRAETEIARQAGVDRMTVRAWLGK